MDALQARFVTQVDPFLMVGLSDECTHYLAILFLKILRNFACSSRFHERHIYSKQYSITMFFILFI